MTNPLDAEDAIAVVLTYEELQLLVRALKAQEYITDDYPALAPVITKLAAFDQCQHLEWSTRLLDASTCKACGVLT